ncbi:MAG: DUF4399 domain-containing protein [Candidatus Macondimonas sp.]
MIRRIQAATLLTLAILAGPLWAELPTTPAPPGAAVYFITPRDGEQIRGPVTVRFGLKGMGVAPAGTVKETTGHHHLLVDLEQPPAAGQPIPSDAHHRHFGNGQTETTLDLTPGRHTLQLLMGDANHVPHRPPVLSERVTIEVMPQ